MFDVKYVDPNVLVELADTDSYKDSGEESTGRDSRSVGDCREEEGKEKTEIK